MVLTDLLISYDIQPAVYFPTKPVSGKVSFTVTDPVQFDCVRVECAGLINTKRTKSTTSSSGFSKNIIYTASETCFQYSKILLDSNGDQISEDDSESMIKPGSYSFPFTFFLPLNCPSSLEGSYGNIRYFCKVTVVQNGNVIFAGKEGFTVIGWIDLNDFSVASRPYQTESHSTSIDEKGGKSLVRMCLRQRGYVAGERINVRMEIVNNSNKTITAIFAQFIQRVNYSAKRQETTSEDCNRWEERKVMQQASRKEKITTKKSALLQWEVFSIPACAPAIFVDSKILHVQYEIQFHVVFDNSVAALVVTAPIFIGTVPLECSFDELQSTRLQRADGITQLDPYLPLMQCYPHLPLPSYVSQQIESVDIRDPEDIVFMPEPVQFTPMTVLYQSSCTPDESNFIRKGLSRRESKESKRPARSRSMLTLNKFGLRGSVDNLAISKDNLNEFDKKDEENDKKKKKGKEEDEKTKTYEKKGGGTLRRWKTKNAFDKTGEDDEEKKKRKEGKEKVDKVKKGFGSLTRWRSKRSLTEATAKENTEEEKEIEDVRGEQKEEIEEKVEKEKGIKPNEKKGIGSFSRWKTKSASVENDASESKPEEKKKKEKEETKKEKKKKDKEKVKDKSTQAPPVENGEADDQEIENGEAR